MDPLPPEAHLNFTATQPVSVAMIDHVVCWLDLLGLRERLKDAANAGTESEFVAEYLRVLTPVYTSLRAEFKDTDFQWHAFTDSIVISVPHHAAEHSEFAIGHEIFAAAEIQFRIARHGWFLRGALAIAPLYANDQFVIGTGLMRAYQLESEEAVFPRVVLDHPIKAQTVEHLGYYAEPYGSPQNNLIVIDEDKRWFINYLYAPIYLDYPEEGALPLYREHRDAVVTKLSQAADNERVRAKYQWVAAYHNWFCSHWISEEFCADLQIQGVAPRNFRQLIESPAEGEDDE